MRWTDLLLRLRRDEAAATAVEYAVMLGLILLVVITGVANFGNAQKAMWTKADTQMKAHGVN